MTKFTGRFLSLQSLATACAVFALLINAKAEPRPPLPPWPESTLGIWGFDEAMYPILPSRMAINAESAQIAESWSGYSLVRDAFTVSPVAIPVVDPGAKKLNFTTSEGTIRFWFRPEWSSASMEGKGPGTYARLVELVGVGGKEPAVVYSLYLNPEGTAVYLTGQGVGGPMDFLSADVNWRAGEWHMLALAYDGKQTTLTIDRATVATGQALPAVASWQKDSLALMIGSDLAGSGPAQGEFDELCAFDYALTPLDLRFYWRGMRKTVAMGPLGTLEEEQSKEQAWNEMLTMQTMSSELPEFPGEDDPPGEGGSWPEYISPVYPSNALWLEITGVTNDVANIIIHGTVPGVWYELMSKEALTNEAWQYESPLWLGAEDQDWTPVTVPVLWRTNNLFLWARSWVDADGNGIPDWWEKEFLGQTGVDPYADADGDSWVNLQEWQNGTSPTAFNTPPPPQGLTVKLGTNGATAELKWLAAGGNVTGYTIERALNWGEETSGGETFNVSAGSTTFTDNTGDLPTGLYFNLPKYRVQAHYASGSSSWGSWSFAPESQWPEAAVVPNANGTATVAVSAIPPTATALRIGLWDYDWENEEYIFVASVDVPAGNFANGPVVLSGPETATLTSRSWCDIQWLQTNNIFSAAAEQWITSIFPFWDGREALAENLRFLLRAANTEAPFNFLSFDPDFWYMPSVNPAHYAYSGIHHLDPDYPSGIEAHVDRFLPFRRNYAHRNFVFWPSDLNSGGALDTGVHGWIWDDSLLLDYPCSYRFSPPTSPASVPTLLSTNDTRWTYFNPQSSYGDLGLIGITPSGTNLTMGSDVRNLFGLRYLSAKLANSPTDIGDLAAGGTIPDVYNYIYPETEQPILQHTGYFFGRPYVDLLPGHADFDPASQPPTIIAGMADTRFEVAGYVKYMVVNGDTNKPAYLGQYFDKAYTANPDGTRSTNETGILSPYGEFFATEPGKTFLTTMPDGVSTNVGECVVNVIKLQLDVNHDGVMNTSWTGPDNTTAERPFVFWNNNDFDREHVVDGDDREEDDLSSNDPNAACPAFPERPIADGDYQVLAGIYQIPSNRDLEDYARLWIPGITALRAAHSNLVFQLSIADNDLSDGPAFNVVQAVETNGGTLYLTDTNVAAQQVYASFPAAARLGPNAPLVLNNLFLLAGQPSDYFIFCGARRGSGRIVLSTWDGTNMLAQTSAWIQIKDIKEMYERWTVGDIGSKPPTNTAYLAVEDLPVGATAFRYEPASDLNTPYILHVHGWNMERWEKDRFAEAAFKRLYWQGYQGCFGSFRWPTRSGFDTVSWQNPATTPNHFDRSEFNAWKSGTPLRQLLSDLNEVYPNQVRLTAHSMGNVTASEALRTNVAIVHTYVAMQAALASHAYDSNAPVRTIPVLADDETPNRYAFYWTNGAPPYLNGAAGANRYVNFFNPDDYALAKWQIDQNLKPADTLGYFYNPDSQKFFKWSNELLFPVDTHEIFSFCDEARCFALGAQPGIQNVFDESEQVDLAELPYSFGPPHKGHSAQFRSTNMKRALFWKQLLITTEIAQP